VSLRIDDESLNDFRRAFFLLVFDQPFLSPINRLYDPKDGLIGGERKGRKMGSPSNHSLSLKIYPVKISGTNG